jgi:hypothetical protein
MSTTLNVGDVFDGSKGMNVYTDIPRFFAYYTENPDIVTPDDRLLTRTNVRISETLKKGSHTLDLSYLKGKYVVVHAASQGGGTGHSHHDVYPNGWFIRARKLRQDGSYDPQGIEISFYQSGCFTAMNTDVPVVSQMSMSVKFVPV